MFEFHVGDYVFSVPEFEQLPFGAAIVSRSGRIFQKSDWRNPDGTPNPHNWGCYASKLHSAEMLMAERYSRAAWKIVYLPKEEVKFND